MCFKKLTLSILLCTCLPGLQAQVADPAVYLNHIRQEAKKTWPENRTINLVFHGHSVPSGYFITPNVHTLQSYPYLTLKAVKKNYPYAVVNSITTAIGGENSEQGYVRFKKEVLTHCPDVLFVDYALNDRSMGLDRARKAWEALIQEALKKQVKVVLMTPTPDLSEDILDPEAPLEKHSRQIRNLAAKFKIGLVDSYATFKRMKQNGEDLTVYMSQSNHPNEKGHQVVCGLIAQWLLEPAQINRMRLDEVKDMMQQVADWQLGHFDYQVVKGSQWPNSHAKWAWTNATLYLGMAKCATLTDDDKYWNFLYAAGESNRWKTGPDIYFADDICITQVYCLLYEKYGEQKMLTHSIKMLDSIMNYPSTANMSFRSPKWQSRWSWCDALFMGPPSYARLGKITGNSRYFDFLASEYRVTYDTLYCSQERLFFRDTRYFTMKEENGKPVFWGRGNGWVVGGLTGIIDHLPVDHPSRAWFIGLFREMMSRIVELQNAQGLWHPSMLDHAAYPMPETSASGFFTYALLWGINHGYLDQQTCGVPAEKAWKALCSKVAGDGKLCYVQAIGADPKKVTQDDTEVYGVGAFLLAGYEMYQYLSNVK